MDVEKFVELRMDRLRIPMFSTLDKQRHDPGDDRGDAAPFQRLGAADKPGDGVDGDDCECVWARPVFMAKR